MSSRSNRSRVIRSSSLGEIGIVSPIEYHSSAPLWEKKPPAAKAKASKVPPANEKPPVKVSKAPAVQEPPRRCSFTVGSPVGEIKRNDDQATDKVDERFGVFLQACFRCKKKLKADEDIFMFGYLRAFCKPECRDKQIDLEYKDKHLERPITKVVEAADQLKEAPAKQGIGLGAKKLAVARFK